MKKIPFNLPTPLGNELTYLAEALRSEKISGDGAFTQKCHDLLQSWVGCKKALLTTSCTHALEMVALLLDIKEGDEIIVPTFTFVSTVNAFMLRGAVPVFVDSRTDTLNIDERLIEKKISKRTKAIVVVHYGGVACEMDEILALGLKHNIPVVEDNAHGLGATYKGRQLGSLGTFATLSFHETKNFSCGEGGALLINDPQYFERAEIIREKGTNRSRFFRGEVDKYNWVDVGSSYLPSDLLAAVLLAQLEARNEILNRRKEIWDFYYRELAPVAEKYGIQLPTVPPTCQSSYLLFHLIAPSAGQRDSLLRHMKANGVWALFHYLPLHQSPFMKAGGYVGSCPVAEDLSERLIRLPLYFSILQEQQRTVVDLLHAFFSATAIKVAA